MHMNTWIMHVENFGKIKRADIEPAPLTLFVGDNNSGKSHIMTLIYGLMNVEFFNSHYQFNEYSRNYEKCKQFIDRVGEDYGKKDNFFSSIELFHAEIEAFEGVLNELLTENKDRLIRDLFNKNIEIGALSLTFHEKNRYKFLCSVSLINKQTERISITGTNGNENIITGRSCQIEKRGDSCGYKRVISFIIEHMINESFGMQSIFFPSARAGYFLTCKSLFEGVINDKSNPGIIQNSLLTQPQNDFLTKVNLITDNAECMVNDLQPAVSVIEKNIIKGQIVFLDKPVQGIFYQPDGTDIQIPVFMASGAITEMTPLLLFLKNEPVQTVFIEEPEICLHPKLQCEIARALIRLVNAGIPVFTTTHSDIILQHINNMIKLAGMTGREKVGKKLGYEGCDWIDKEKAAVYQFDIDKSGKTVINRLPCGEFGFEVMSFYNALEELNEQIRMIEAG